ncbi:nuclear pore complex protein Nup93-1 [Drosophila sulfurigaster albostrigata]|uniref:nuclear pore complex protein Nup93-1 n=1 Tax=Drosophila sulfurigaster albostrigata TaxID=89887 RepID=UPI002D21C6AC|nr:nuclear pore complex protein Nup93-1 [Drosophila sulfurigaster albostrigata]
MDLNELLQQAQRLNNETKMDTEMPRVERTLSQVLQATQEMHSRVTQAGTNDLQAHILMGSRGVDLPKLTQKLESLSARKSFEPLNPLADTDVEGYLKNERENAIIAVIEETNKNIFRNVERIRMWRMFAEWGEEKERLLNALVGPNQEDFPDVHRQMVPTVLPQDALPRSRLNRMEAIYAHEICAYNQSATFQWKLQGHRPNLLTKLTQLAKETLSNLDSQVHEMWSVLSYMANVSPLGRSTDPLKARQTGPQFVQQALAYLEKCYRQYMNTVIQKNRLVGLRGGIPNVYNTVSSFVSITFQQPQSLVGLLDVSHNRPLWALVYYSLRSGDYAAAVQFLKEGGVCPELLKLLQHKQQQQKLQQQQAGHPQQFGYLERPHAKFEGQLKLEYNNKLRVCTDPYKKAVYAIVLACDPQEPHQEVVRTIDDFLWMQLSVLATDERPDYHIERLSYGGLQSLILDKYGENYFNAREKTPLYFQVLVLTGQFESAIEFLARTDANRPHAVHMAIALNELGMLGTPGSVQQPLLSADSDDPAPMRRLNLARLIIMYTKCFEQTDTNEALQYYYLLRNFKSHDGRNLMLSCICDLLVENCDDKLLQLIFGTSDANDPWTFNGGIFTQFPNMAQDKQALASMVGDELSQRTKFELAIKLYFIAGQLEQALRLLCSLLTQVVHQPSRPGSMREQLTAIAERMNHALARRKMDVDEHVLGTYQLLSQLLKFFDYYHAGESRLAAEVLAKHRITPDNCREVDSCVSSLKLIGSDIIKVLPDVLLAAMDLIHGEYQRLKGGNLLQADNDNSSSTISDKEELLQQLRQRAKALTNMAATLPYRMPSDTNNRLVQLEILMH